MSIWPGLVLFVTILIVYLRTLAPGVFGFDSAELASGVHTLGIIHPPGYPLYILLGKMFTLLPVGDTAYRLNLMSAFWAAVTIWLVYRVNLLLFGNQLIAWGTAFLLGISNYFWQMAVVAEVYTLHSAFLAFNIYVLLAWRKDPKSYQLMAFAFSYGLSLSNHTSGILFAPGFAWLILSSEHWQKSMWRLVPAMFAIFCAGLAPYIYLPLRAAANPPLNYVTTYYEVNLSTISGVWWMVTAQAYRFFGFAYALNELPTQIIQFGAYFWRSFFGAGVLLGLAGLVHLFQKSRSILVGLLFIFTANSVFYINYRVLDKDTMFLPSYVIWSILLAGGIHLTADFIRSRIHSRNRPNTLAAGVRIRLLTLSAALLILPGMLINWGYVDMSRETTAQQFASRLFTNAPRDALILAGWSPAVILEYYQVVEGQRPDLAVLNLSRVEVAHYYRLWREKETHAEIMKAIQINTVQLIELAIQERPVYAVEYNLDLANSFEFLPRGTVFQLVPKHTTDGNRQP